LVSREDKNGGEEDSAEKRRERHRNFRQRKKEVFFSFLFPVRARTKGKRASQDKIEKKGRLGVI